MLYQLVAISQQPRAIGVTKRLRTFSGRATSIFACTRRKVKQRLQAKACLGEVLEVSLFRSKTRHCSLQLCLHKLSDESGVWAAKVRLQPFRGIGDIVGAPEVTRGRYCGTRGMLEILLDFSAPKARSAWQVGSPRLRVSKQVTSAETHKLRFVQERRIHLG